MEIQRCINIVPNFHDSTLNYLLRHINEIEYTGFFVENSNGINDYYFKIGNDFYIVKASNYKELEKILVEELNVYEKNNSQGNLSIKSLNINRSSLSLYQLMSLYKYNNRIRVDDYFVTTSNDTIHGNKTDFLNLVKNILLLEQELKINVNMANKYDVMKYIYNKYKMSVDYWDPVANYGGIQRANVELLYDKNRVINHPYSMLGLINDNYATCEGMARGLMELYRYFGIDAEFVHNELHGVCKINLKDNFDQKKVTYIDLSKEVTRYFQDNKYEYIDRKPILRSVSNRIATPNSYDYFLKGRIGESVNDSDVSLAVDYKPQIRIISVEERGQARL